MPRHGCGHRETHRPELSARDSTARAPPDVCANAAICVDWLRSQQVYLDPDGVGHATPPPETLNPYSMPPAPLPGRQRAWKTLIADRTAHFAAPVVPFLRNRSGPEGGAYLHATPAELGYTFSDAQWLAATRFRLALRVCSPGHCTHPRSSDTAAARQGTPCGDTLDANGTHACACNIGGGVTAIHDNIADILYDASRAAGYSALCEQVIPTLFTPKRREPRLDVELWGHTAAPDALLDVTVCAPWAARYAHDPATATTTAEKRKDDSYPRIGGIGVTGIAVDLYGGFGPGLSSLLSDLANLARTRDISRGGAPRRLLHAWRTRISAAIARGVGRQLESAQRVGGPHPDAALVSPIPPGPCQRDTRADCAAGVSH